MSNNVNERYWYFRFTKDFFRDKAIRDLKYIPVVGYQYGWIYLQMCSLCLYDGSYTLRVPKATVGDSYITYIANEIGEEPKIVQQAVGYFIANGFIELFEEEDAYNLYFEKMKNNMGKSSKDADRKRLYETEKLQTKEEVKLIEYKENEEDVDYILNKLL